MEKRWEFFGGFSHQMADVLRSIYCIANCTYHIEHTERVHYVKNINKYIHSIIPLLSPTMFCFEISYSFCEIQCWHTVQRMLLLLVGEWSHKLHAIIWYSKTLRTNQKNLPLTKCIIRIVYMMEWLYAMDKARSPIHLSIRKFPIPLRRNI